jgi:hypothetical protein
MGKAGEFVAMKFVHTLCRQPHVMSKFADEATFDSKNMCNE